VASEIQLQWAGPGAATAGAISDLVVEFDANWGNLISLYGTLTHA
jgi:hypothetical protein